MSMLCELKMKQCVSMPVPLPLHVQTSNLMIQSEDRVQVDLTQTRAESVTEERHADSAKANDLRSEQPETEKAQCEKSTETSENETTEKKKKEKPSGQDRERHDDHEMDWTSLCLGLYGDPHVGLI